MIISPGFRRKAIHILKQKQVHFLRHEAEVPHTSIALGQLRTTFALLAFATRNRNEIEETS